ncbi:MAG: hypothetical protein WBL66_08990, partial [Candidatus Acidiferrales bacterium]
PKVNFREEVVNVALAELLEQRGMVSVPETIRKSVARQTRDLPDIIVADLLGIRMVIEGRFNSGQPARASLLKDARERVEQGVSPVCLAALYPPELRSADSLSRLRRNLERASLVIRVISENNDGEWADGTVDDIVETLRRSYELLVSEDVVVAAVMEIASGIETASNLFTRTQSLSDRFRKALGIPQDASGENEDED